MDSKKLIEEQQKARERMVDEILKAPAGGKRWRKAVEVWLQLNPKNENGITAREENQYIVNSNRQETLVNKSKYKAGGSETAFRGALRMPAGAMHFIELADPDAFTKENDDELFKTFPEYVRTRGLYA